MKENFAVSGSNKGKSENIEISSIHFVFNINTHVRAHQ